MNSARNRRKSPDLPVDLPVDPAAPGTRYPGGKGAPGVFHKIIGLMPPHEVYIEPFVGGGAVLRHKAPARSSIVVDIDPAAHAPWSTIAAAGDSAGIPGLLAIHGDGIQFLREYVFAGRELVYCDPPYVLAARRGGAIYRHEMTDEQHRELLAVLSALPAPFLLSGYRTAMYDDAADRHGWRRIDFQAMTRGGLATESLWLNYEPPAERHDYRYLGNNFRERERIKRKQARWRAKLEKMPRAEQLAMMEVLAELTASP